MFLRASLFTLSLRTNKCRLVEIFTNETIIICIVSVTINFLYFVFLTLAFFTLFYGNVQSLSRDLSLTNVTVLQIIKILLTNFFSRFPLRGCNSGIRACLVKTYIGGFNDSQKIVILFPSSAPFSVSCCFRGLLPEHVDSNIIVRISRVEERYKTKVMCFAMREGIVHQQSDVCGDVETNVNEPRTPASPANPAVPPTPFRFSTFPLPRDPTVSLYFPSTNLSTTDSYLFLSLSLFLTQHLAVFSNSPRVCLLFIHT